MRTARALHLDSEWLAWSGMRTGLYEAMSRRGMRLSIRNPHIFGDINLWAPERYFDGAELSPRAAIELMEVMLDQGSFWCGLEGPDFRICVGEWTLYLHGSPRFLSRVFENAHEVACPHHPEDQDDADVIAADARYWSNVGDLVRSEGRVLLEQWWAEGDLADSWYELTPGIDTAAIVASAAPRSRFAAYPPSHFRVIQSTGWVTGVIATLDYLGSPGILEGVLPSDLVCLSRVDDARLSAVFPDCISEVLEFHVEQRRDWFLLRRDNAWDGAAGGIGHAVLPDPDGVVRAPR